MFRCYRWSEKTAAEWPPPPHDPRERVHRTTSGDWQVRAFAPTDPKFEYLARRGLWHLQLWHSDAGVSILSPSGLTVGHYEIYPVAGWKHWVKDHRELTDALFLHHGLAPPSAGTLAALEAWLVHDPVAALPDARAPVVVRTELQGTSSALE